MTKDELVDMIKSIPAEDCTGKIEAIFHDRFGGSITTDSIRLDMDGGRLIIAQKGSGYHKTNQQNWERELEFVRNTTKQGDKK